MFKTYLRTYLKKKKLGSSHFLHTHIILCYIYQVDLRGKLGDYEVQASPGLTCTNTVLMVVLFCCKWEDARFANYASELQYVNKKIKKKKWDN